MRLAGSGYSAKYLVPVWFNITTTTSSCVAVHTVCASHKKGQFVSVQTTGVVSYHVLTQRKCADTRNLLEKSGLLKKGRGRGA